MHVNDLIENALNEVFDYLSLAERVKCEAVCRRWRQVLSDRPQPAIKLCFEANSNLTKPICSSCSHQPSSNDVLYLDDQESPASNGNAQNANGNRPRPKAIAHPVIHSSDATDHITGTSNVPGITSAMSTLSVSSATITVKRSPDTDSSTHTVHKPATNGAGRSEVKFDRLLSKFSQTTAIHLQCKDIKLLRRSNVLSGLSKHAARLQHLEIELFEGPFTRNDLLLLVKNWTKSLKHLLITFHFDAGKFLNRKTIMKFLEICINLELFYWRAPHLTEQRLEYVPAKLSALHLYETELELQSLSLLANENSAIFSQLRLSNITGAHLQVILNLPFLRVLSVDSIVQLEDLSALSEIRRLSRLEVLRFWLEDKGAGERANNLDNEMLAIIKACNQMRRCHIENAVLTDRSISLVSAYWKHLQSFKLYSSTFNDQNAVRHSLITDRSLAELLKLNHLHTLAIPNGSLSQRLLEQLIDRPTFSFLVLRERCSFVDDLFQRLLRKSTQAAYNEYKLKIGDEDTLFRLATIARPANFEFRKAKVFNFDLF